MSDRKLSIHQEHEVLGKLEDAGLDSDLAQQIIESPGNKFAKKVVDYIQRGGYDPSTSQKRAKEIMGENYLGPEDAMKHFGVSYTDKELIQLREIPFTEAELEACKKTHILFAGYSLSILDIRNKAKHLFYNQDWYNSQAFATKEKVNLQWYLVRKDEVPNSTSKTWSQQQSLLTSDESVPRACEVVFMVMLYCLVTGKRLLANMYVRCIDLDSGGFRVNVGSFDSGGLSVSYRSGDYCYGRLGLAAARK
jgi:hypothetical protein